jgi:hypothetical protein
MKFGRWKFYSGRFTFFVYSNGGVAGKSKFVVE